MSNKNFSRKISAYIALTNCMLIFIQETFFLYPDITNSREYFITWKCFTQINYISPQERYNVYNDVSASNDKIRLLTIVSLSWFYFREQLDIQDLPYSCLASGDKTLVDPQCCKMDNGIFYTVRISEQFCPFHVIHWKNIYIFFLLQKYRLYIKKSLFIRN